MTATARRRTAETGTDVAVVGAGYVGLTTAVCLAHFGHRVCCGDLDATKVGQLSRGVPTIVEKGLTDLLREGLASGLLRFVSTAVGAVKGAEFVFLCVPTPQRADGSADVSALESAVKEIRPHLSPSAVVVNKSTVPMGSAAHIEQLLARTDVAVVSNPEFLREGSAVQDTLHPDRVVVGSANIEAASRVGRLFAATKAPIIVTDTASAETIKYASNAFLATRLSFVNAVADLCEAVGADVRDVLLGMAHDHRIGSNYLTPGPGWGGSCLPKDIRALAFMAKSAGYEFPLLDAVVRANEEHLASIVDKARRALGGSVAGATVGAWGLTFKAGTDDRRDSPAVEILRRLAAEGARLQAFDPTTVGRDVSELPQSVVICDDAYSACSNADLLVVLTEWEELRLVDFAKVRDAMATPRVVDGRNLFDAMSLRELGFAYIGLGRS